MTFYFDENWSPLLVRGLTIIRGKKETGFDFVHLLQRFPAGTPDEVWIPVIAGEHCVVLTSDRAKRGHGSPLPVVCVANRVRHVLASGKVHQLGTWDKCRAVMCVWPELLATGGSVPGSRFKLKKAGAWFRLESALPHSSRGM